MSIGMRFFPLSFAVRFGEWQSSFKWRKFSIRTLVIVLPVLVALVMFLIARPLRRHREFNRLNSLAREQIRVIEQSNGTVRIKTPAVALGWGWQYEQLMIEEVDFSGIAGSSRVRRFPRSAELYGALKQIGNPYLLRVDWTDFGNDDLRQLEGSRIGSIHAAGSLLTDEQLGIKCPSELIYVNVSDTEIGDEFIRWASSHGNLVFADFARTRVTDRVVDSIVQNSRLTSLSIAGTKLTPDAKKRLRKLGLLNWPGSN